MMYLKRRSLLFLAALVVVLAASACVGGPTEISWGVFSLAGEPQNILFAFSDRIVLIDPADGSPVELRDDEGNVRVDDQGNPRLWEVRGSGNPPLQFYTSPIFVDDSTMMTTSYDGKMLEVDFPTARILNPETQSIGGHVVADSLATPEFFYIPLSEADVAAFEPSDFSEAVWRFDTGQGVWAEPLLVDDTLFVTSLDHHLYALDPETGGVRWQLDLEGAVSSTPIYNDGFLYVGSFARKLFKISTDGEIVAQFDTHDWIWGEPTYLDGILYAADLAGYVYALEDNGDSFTAVWEPRKVANGAIRATPLVTGDTIILGSRDRNTYWINRETGVELFHREMVGEVLADLLLLEPSETLNIPEPMVIVGTMANEELLVAFSLGEGQRLWRYGR